MGLKRIVKKWQNKSKRKNVLTSENDQNRKIFCIGFNKTGTSSLHDFFEDVGLTSTHNDYWPAHSHAFKIDETLFQPQCYSDGEKSDFVALDNCFPNSIFILNTRDEKKWLYSRLKHVMRYNENIDSLEILSDSRYRWMARDFFANEDLAIRKWICERRIYTAQVKLYFADKPNFIELDVTTNSDWTNELIVLLEKNDFQIDKHGIEQSYHANKRGDKHIKDQAMLDKYKDKVEQILAEINGEN